MISDVLHDAASQIRDYMREFPDAYEGIEHEVQDVLDAMDRLRRYLDTPPGQKVIPDPWFGVLKKGEEAPDEKPESEPESEPDKDS